MEAEKPFSSPFKSPILCLVTDLSRADLLKQVEGGLAGGVNMVQLRGQGVEAAVLYQTALTLRSLCDRYSAFFIVNDRLDIGMAAQSSGFQIGKNSLPPAAARRLAGVGKLLGVSVHNVEEARRAAQAQADFLVVGTIFPSRSHPGGPVAGPPIITAINQAVPLIPLIGIGGITPQNSSQVLAAGAIGVAVISGILEAKDCFMAAQSYRKVLGF